MELWRDIACYEGFYQVSNYGRVRSVDRIVESKAGWRVLKKGRVIKQHLDGSGYPKVGLCKNNSVKNFHVHTLVAEAFPEICGVWEEGLEVNHRNEDKTDNTPENLHYLSHKDNLNYGTRNKRSSENLKGTPAHNRKIVVVFKDGVEIDSCESVVAAGKKYGVTESSVRGCIYGRIHIVKKHFTFKYEDGTGKWDEERLSKHKADDAERAYRKRHKTA